MRRLASIAVVLTVVVLSCYGPHYGRCTIPCTMGAPNQCPDGFTCSGVACVSNSEADTGSDLCTEVVDAGSGSQGTDGSGSGSCSFSYETTNYDPCDAQLGTAIPPPVFSNGMNQINTDALPTITTNATYGVMHVTQFSIGPMAQVAVTGNLPLLVVSEGDVTIDGRLEATKLKLVTSLPTCIVGGGADGSLGGNGGGGGGNGTTGGSGGASGTGTGGLAGMSTVTSRLSPLALGCPGGAGGSGGGVEGGAGGSPGGAIEISARGTLDVHGMIYADGGGGGGGSGFGGLGAGAGGGGASGGSIVLEGDTATIEVGASVCALGGGGGGGGQGSGTVIQGMFGSDAIGCLSGAAGGGGSFGGSGGSAGGAGFPGETVGSAAMNVGIGGGGGGGGNGAICVRGGSTSNHGTIAPSSNCP